MDRPAPFALRYYAYRGATAVGFTAPIWYLYLFEHGLGYTEVALVNAVWWTGLIVFEIPTGYVGDRIGRRESLIAAVVLTALGNLGMVAAGTTATFAVVMAVWALGETMRQGVDDAWLYDVLRARTAEETFVRLRGRGNAVALVVTGATALAGGALAEGNMDHAYLATAAAVTLSVPVVYGFPDSTADDGDPFTVLDALPVLRREFSAPPLRSFVLLVALLTGVHWGINFFVQPVAVELGFSTTHLGGLYAGFTGIGAVVGYRAEWIADQVGIRTWFRALPVALGALFLAVAVVPPLAIPAFVVARSTRAATTPLANQFINDRVDSLGRATVLSAVGMVYNLLTVPFELGAGALADVLGPLRTIGLFGGVLVGGAAVIALVGRPFADPDPVAEPAD